jgi:predicted DNA-binding transcriptional regulator YafY
MGIRITGERGPHGAYRLERGSRLPPLIFNDAEAAAILLGLKAVSSLHFPVDPSASEGAAAKIERLLPENLLEFVKDIQHIVRVSPPMYLSQAGGEDGELLLDLTQAVKLQKRINILYQSSSGECTEREVDLYGFAWNEGHWYTAGYCHLRQGLRVFRVDRILSFSATEESFIRPRDFEADQFIREGFKRSLEYYEVEVWLDTTLEEARAAMPSEVHALRAREYGVEYRIQSAQLDQLSYALLNLRFPLVIQSPVELKQIFQKIAKRADELSSS